mgnify:CR=1 FL=1
MWSCIGAEISSSSRTIGRSHRRAPSCHTAAGCPRSRCRCVHAHDPSPRCRVALSESAATLSYSIERIFTRAPTQVHLLRLHNQTVNTWSHVLGLPFVLIRFFQPLDPQQPYL